MSDRKEIEYRSKYSLFPYEGVEEADVEMDAIVRDLGRVGRPINKQDLLPFGRRLQKWYKDHSDLGATDTAVREVLYSEFCNALGVDYNTTSDQSVVYHIMEADFYMFGDRASDYGYAPEKEVVEEKGVAMTMTERLNDRIDRLEMELEIDAEFIAGKKAAIKQAAESEWAYNSLSNLITDLKVAQHGYSTKSRIRNALRKIVEECAE